MRKEVEKLIKVANSPKLIKMINPARLHLSSEDELMVVLNLQEPPSVDNSFIEAEEQKQEPEPVVKKETPTPAPAAPTKKQKLKEQAQKKRESAKDERKPKAAVAAKPNATISTPGQSAGQIVVVLPIGVPGMGKSHYAEQVLSNLF